MDSELKKLIMDERVLLDHVAFDILEIPESEFHKFGSSALILAMADDNRDKTEFDNEIEGEANKKFDMLCRTVPNISRDAVRAISIAYSSYELLFGECRTEEISQTEAVMGILSIAESRGFALGAASSGSSSSEIMRKQHLSMAGLRGALAKHRLTDELKAWAEQQPEALDDKLNRTARARKLADKMPKHYALKLDDPVRVIRDHLKQKDELRLAGQP